MELPFGLGTFQNTDPEACTGSVRTALELGYRHVDTAQGYDNEAAVGEGLATADVDREDVVVATKVATGNLAGDDVRATVPESLDRLGVDAVDLLYVHWPLGEYDPEDTLRAFDDLHDQGLVRHVGLSNFTPELLDEARGVLDAPVAAHQVEMHPLLPQADLREYAERHGHELVAYSPLGRGELLDHDVLAAVAEEYDATTAQVCLAWVDAKGAVPIPKATSDTHVRENYGAASLELDPEDVARIDAIEDRERFIDPDAAAWNQ